MPRSGTIKYGNRAVMFCFGLYAHYLFGRRGVRVFLLLTTNYDKIAVMKPERSLTDATSF